MTTPCGEARASLKPRRDIWRRRFGIARKRPALWVLALLGLFVAAVLAGLLFPRQVLCVDSGEVQADALVVLGGGLGERPARAAELFRSGAAPKIIVSGFGDCTNNLQILIASGVPLSAIELECQSKSTQQNAEFSAALLHALKAKRVIIVTSWYHSRRSLNCFRHYATDIQFYTVSAQQIEHPPFRAPSERIRACQEYFKLCWYLIRYGIRPF
jgi:uncharacterized SAM-binding protein YcdF (DUF218 family)